MKNYRFTIISRNSGKTRYIFIKSISFENAVKEVKNQIYLLYEDISGYIIID